MSLNAAERLALVIGIADYKTISPLKNTINDARGMASTLESIGFEVMALENPSGAQIDATLERFAFEAELAELAVIYFAGHGVQVQGENFLIPVDAKIASNADIQDQSVSLKRLLNAVDNARKMRVVILDACRDNPFEDVIEVSQSVQSSGSGMAEPSPERGTMVAFAARDGQVALDGNGNNSPFTQALMQNLTVPEVDISLMFRRVRDQVLRTTNNQQEPFTYGSLPGVPFYLAGGSVQDSASPKAMRLGWQNLGAEQETIYRGFAAEGDTRALIGLAYSKLGRLSDGYNPQEAVELLSQAATLGSAEAQYELALQLEAGEGIARDESRALELFRQAAAQDYPDALNDMGYFHFLGKMGLPEDITLGIEFIGRAAEQRHTQALYNYAAIIDDKLVPGRTAQDAAQFLYLALRTGNVEVLQILKDNPASLTRPTWVALQNLLQQYEFYDGTVDGSFGPATERGLRRAAGLQNG
ncbi:MAG: caspase family protein [Litoreibacter sp.]